MPYRFAIFLFLLLFSTLSIKATNYYTLQNGAWEDVTTVWSTDGINPCTCSPANQMISPTDSIFIEDNITFSTPITLQGVTTIGSKGVLTGVQAIQISGQVHNYGYIECENMLVSFSGWLNNQAPLTLTMGDLINFGGLIDLGSSVALYVGNIQNQLGGRMNLLTGSSVHVSLFFINEGLLNLELNNCLRVDWDFYNFPPGILTGGGYLRVGNDILNASQWGDNVRWCALGTATGVSSLPTCTNCGGALGVDLVEYTGFPDELTGGSNLSWIVGQEAGVSSYLIEKSTDGTNFSKLGNVISKAHPGQTATYQFRDSERLFSVATYRLSEVSPEGGVSFLGQVRVSPEAMAETFSFDVYPNPFEKNLNLGYLGLEAGLLEIGLYDLQGRLLLQYSEGEVQPGARIVLNAEGIQAGFYLLRIQGNGRSFTQKVVKK